MIVRGLWSPTWSRFHLQLILWYSRHFWEHCHLGGEPAIYVSHLCDSLCLVRSLSSSGKLFLSLTLRQVTAPIARFIVPRTHLPCSPYRNAECCVCTVTALIPKKLCPSSFCSPGATSICSIEVGLDFSLYRINRKKKKAFYITKFTKWSGPSTVETLCNIDIFKIQLNSQSEEWWVYKVAEARQWTSLLNTINANLLILKISHGNEDQEKKSSSSSLIFPYFSFL